MRDLMLLSVVAPVWYQLVKKFKWASLALLVAFYISPVEPSIPTDFFDMEFNHLPFRSGHNYSSSPVMKPIHFNEMKKFAATISKGYPHMRVDLYDINGSIFFGEVTFFHWGGFVPFDPPEWDYKIGEMMTLPSRKECRFL